MLSPLIILFGSKSVRPTVAIKFGEIFPWHRGVCLQAREDSELVFPGELIRDGEQIASIIEADDAALLGFQQRPDGSFERIILRLKAGHAVTLHRGSDVVLGSSEVAERVFNIVNVISAI